MIGLVDAALLDDSLLGEPHRQIGDGVGVHLVGDGQHLLADTKRRREARRDDAAREVPEFCIGVIDGLKPFGRSGAVDLADNVGRCDLRRIGIGAGLVHIGIEDVAHDDRADTFASILVEDGVQRFGDRIAGAGRERSKRGDRVLFGADDDVGFDVVRTFCRVGMVKMHGRGTDEIHRCRLDIADDATGLKAFDDFRAVMIFSHRCSPSWNGAVAAFRVKAAGRYSSGAR